MASPLKRGEFLPHLPTTFPVHDSGPTGPRLFPRGFLHSGTPLFLQGGRQEPRDCTRHRGLAWPQKLRLPRLPFWAETVWCLSLTLTPSSQASALHQSLGPVSLRLARASCRPLRAPELTRAASCALRRTSADSNLNC